MTKKDRDSYNYKGWLNSNSFLKRVFAIMGYNLFGGLIIWGAIIIMLIIFLILDFLFSSI